MSNTLPSYLRFHTDGRPLAGSVVTLGDVRLTAITPRLIRIEQGVWTDAATLTVLHRAFCPVALRVAEADGLVTVDTGALTIRVRLGCPLAEGLTIESQSAPHFLWHPGQKPLQNLKGTVSTLDDVNGPCPLDDGLCALDGFTFFADGDTPTFTQEGWFAPREAETDIYFFGYGHDYLACVQDFQRLTGPAALLPAFVFGNWWSRYHAYTQDEYLRLMDQFAQKDVPLSVGIIDMDWHLTRTAFQSYGEGWTGYTWNEDLFPDHAAFLRALHDRGLKTALNLHPSKGVRPYEKAYPEMAAIMGRTDGQAIPFNCLDPVFLKAYFEALHFPMEAEGVDFWWMDWQQGTDYEAVSGDIFTPAQKQLFPITPLWMLNHMHMLASRRNGGRGMIFSRYAGYGSGREPIGFSGDTISTWESLRFQPYFTATASNAGYGWWSHDIGGHMLGIRDDELTARWVQLGVFSPMFRLHSTSHPFNSREPWLYDRRSEEVIERFMRLRHRLFPYLYTMNRRASEDLVPLVQPMYYTHPERAEAYDVPNEYWFGSELIAAPITAPADASGLAAARVWLPDGMWTDAMTGVVYRGGRTLTVCRPLEEMPLFLKAGALVPMQAHIPGCNALGASAEMELWAAPGASNRFTLYEDDGESLAYRQGHFCQTHITLDWTDTAATLRVAPAAGDTALLPALRRWTVHLCGLREGCEVRLDGAAPETCYDSKTASLTVTVQAAVDAGFALTITCPDGLISPNDNVPALAMDRLMRAQMALAEKDRLFKAFNDALDAPGREDRWYVNRMQSDTSGNLGLALAELLMQRHSR